MTPRQKKVYAALSYHGTMSAVEIVRITGMNRTSVHHAVTSLTEMNRITCDSREQRLHYTVVPIDYSAVVEPMVDRAIRTRPVLQTIWQGA